MKRLNSIPNDEKFWMPGEFEPHEGVYMLWPERPDNWHGGAKPAQHAFVQIATAIVEFEPVTVGVVSRQYENARRQLPDQVRVVEIDYNSAWARDNGPTFVANTDGLVRGINWDFNSWGGLVDGIFFPWDKDDLVAVKICEVEQKDYYDINNFVLEGGSIHVDGEGTLIVTEECLLSKGRNPHLSKEEIDQTLKNYLGVEKIIWLKRGLYGDVTNGHVDNIVNYVKPGEVVLAWTDDTSDPQYEISKECLDILESETDAKGRSIVVHKMHAPKPLIMTKEEAEGVDVIKGTLPRAEGNRLSATYVNYYTANGGVIYPTFDDPMDERAHALLESLYPNRKVVGVPGREIVLGGGNIHCITQQIPMPRK